MRTRSYRPDSTLLTCVHHKRGPKSGRAIVPHTHAQHCNAEHHGGEGVVGGFAAGSGSRKLRWRLLVLIPKDDASSFLFGGRHRAALPM